MVKKIDIITKAKGRQFQEDGGLLRIQMLLRCYLELKSEHGRKAVLKFSNKVITDLGRSGIRNVRTEARIQGKFQGGG